MKALDLFFSQLQHQPPLHTNITMVPLIIFPSLVLLRERLPRFWGVCQILTWVFSQIEFSLQVSFLLNLFFTSVFPFYFVSLPHALLRTIESHCWEPQCQRGWHWGVGVDVLVEECGLRASDVLGYHSDKAASRINKPWILDYSNESSFWKTNILQFFHVIISLQTVIPSSVPHSIKGDVSVGDLSSRGQLVSVLITMPSRCKSAEPKTGSLNQETRIQDIKRMNTPTLWSFMGKSHPRR